MWCTWQNSFAFTAAVPGYTSWEAISICLGLPISQTITVRESTKKGVFHCSSCNSDLTSLFTLISQSKHLHCRDTAILNVQTIQYIYQLVQECFDIALTIALMIIKFLFNRRGIKLMAKLWMDRPPVFETHEQASLLHPFTGSDFD